jgi:pantoate--beta-alanine ligase
MQTLERIDATRRLVAARRRDGVSVALVPTMGNLHDGHLSLVRVARSRAGCVIASVFVNPLQFGPQEDFDRYPRSFARDCELLAAEGVEAVFAPTVAEMYPAGPGEQTLVEVPAFSGMLEGQRRPGHFAGVATVVTKLFNIVAPDVAVFGEKDFQQLAVIRRLVHDLCLPIDVVGAPIVRDPDGLALSSRNQYLSPAERRVAPGLHRALQAARRRVEAGDRSWASIEAQACAVLEGVGFEPDYVAVRRALDLLPPGDTDATADLVVLGAASLGRTRLIDNLRVG